jgi:hypothetical protein
VVHGDEIWVDGVGFPANTPYQLKQCASYPGGQAQEIIRCRYSSSFAFADGDGSFEAVMGVGQNVFAPPNVSPSATATPTYDLRDGQTVVVNAGGLPQYGGFGPSFDVMDSPTGSWIGAFQGGSPNPVVRSQSLSFSGSAPEVHVLVGQAIVQETTGFTHMAAVNGTAPREATWNAFDGTIQFPYTAVQRWASASGPEPFDPLPVENGYYDFADQLTPTGGVATGPVRSDLVLLVVEGSDPPGPGNVVTLIQMPLQFARFDLTAQTTGGVISAKPASVTLSGQVTCTGFMPETYIVSINGTIEQVTVNGKKTTTRTASFTKSISCAGTMTNPGVAYWSVTVPGPFKAGTAKVTLAVSSAGFTRSGDPLQVVQSDVALTAPPKRR